MAFLMSEYQPNRWRFWKWPSVISMPFPNTLYSAGEWLQVMPNSRRFGRSPNAVTMVGVCHRRGMWAFSKPGHVSIQQESEQSI